MATSAFKSTTRRTSVGASSSPDDSVSSSSANRTVAGAHRRSRSLSRFSRRLLVPECPDDGPAPKGRFVNTERGSGFPEISLDDLAIQLFSDEMESEEGGRSLSLSRRSSNISPWTSAGESQRQGRSVSRPNRRVGDGKSSDSNNSVRGRSVCNKLASDQISRRRRSVSVVRHRIKDSESDIDHSYKSHNRGIQNSLLSGNTQLPLLEEPITLNHRQGLGRSLSQKDMSKLQEGYYSQSSALTDDEARDMHSGKNGIERTIRAVYAQKTENPTGDDTYSGLYEAMRIELRHAVEEIKKELEQAKVRPRSSVLENDDCMRSNNSDALQAVSTIRRNYATKLEQSEKRKHDLLAEILLEEERGRELSKIVRELHPDPKNSTIVQRPLRTRKRSNDRNRLSKRLTKEAEKYLEDFISNIEDTDISSFDGERSDSSTLGGITKPKGPSTHCRELETSPAISKSVSVEMDGVVLPWLRWDTSDDISCKNRMQSPVTPKIFLPVTAQDGTTTQDESTHCASSHGSWSPGITGSADGREVTGNKFGEGQSNQIQSCSSGGTRFGYDIEDYLTLQNSEDLLFETLKQQQRIKSGGLLLCNKHFI